MKLVVISTSYRMTLLLIIVINTYIYFTPTLLSTPQVNTEPVNLGYSTKNVAIAQPNV